MVRRREIQAGDLPSRGVSHGSPEGSLPHQDLSSKCRQAGPHMSRHSQKQIQSRTLNGAGPHLDNGTHVRTRGRRSFRPRSREDMEGDTRDCTPHSKRMDPEICNGSMMMIFDVPY